MARIGSRWSGSRSRSPAASGSRAAPIRRLSARHSRAMLAVVNCRVALARRLGRILLLVSCSVAAEADAALAMPDAAREFFEQGTSREAYASVAVGLVQGAEQQTWF